MKNWLILIALLIASPAWGCESFEDCMTAPGSYDVQLIQVRSLTAIAFKLEEISKKLDKPETPKVAINGPNRNVTDLKSCLELANWPVVYQENIDSCYKRYGDN